MYVYLHTRIAEKIELGLEISLPLWTSYHSGPQRGCNWHANTLLHCPNSIHRQDRIPFSLLGCCEMFPYKTNSVVSGRCAAQYEKCGCFLSMAKLLLP